jgi:hypothetical protein
MSAKPGDRVLQRLERDAAKATACALLESSASGHGPCRSEHLISRTSANVKPCVAKMGMQTTRICAQQGRVVMRQSAAPIGGTARPNELVLVAVRDRLERRPPH